MNDSWRVKYDQALIPRRHKSFRTTNNLSQDWFESHEKVKSILTNKGICVILGQRGQGKTQSAACVIGFCCQDLNKTALYTKAFDVFLSIRNGNNQNSDTTEKKEVSKFIKPFLLVIDAFEVRGDTAFENRVMDDIIDKRYDEEKPTIIISNDSIASVTKTLGASIVDRMHESGGFVEFKNGDFRKNKGV